MNTMGEGLKRAKHVALLATVPLWIPAGPAVLDIGSGWGGLGVYLAKTMEVDVPV